MQRGRIRLAVATGALGALALGAVAVADSGRSEKLTGYEEVPALSTPGTGELQLAVNRGNTEVRYRLTARSLESGWTQAHIHFENHTNNGPIVVFLCSNLGNGPAGTQGCPVNGGTVSGVIRAANIGDGAAAQGLAAGEFQEFLRAVKAGATYVNVHTTGRPTGEIRSQINDDHEHHGEGHGNGNDDD